MHDHRASGGVATVPVLDDPTVGQHETRVTTGFHHGRKTTRQATGSAWRAVTANCPRIGRMNRLVSGLIVITVFVLAACGSGAPSSSVGSAAPPAPSAAASSAASTAAERGGRSRPDRHRLGPHLGHAPERLSSAIPGAQAVRRGRRRVRRRRPWSSPGDVARQVATAMLTFLPSAGFQTEGLVDAPREWRLRRSRRPGPTTGCMLQVTVEPDGRRDPRYDPLRGCVPPRLNLVRTNMRFGAAAQRTRSSHASILQLTRPGIRATSLGGGDSCRLHIRETSEHSHSSLRVFLVLFVLSVMLGSPTR